jgi:CheY-like chemotaxis protein
MGGSSENASLAGRRILVVEDQYLLADDIRRVLERAGAEVIGPVPSLEAGLEAVATTELHAAVLDINLNGSYVFPVAEELARRNIPIVFATGYDEWFVPTAFKGHTRIEKPIDPREIVEALERALAGPAAGV